MAALRLTASFFAEARELIPHVLERESAKVIAFKTGVTPRTAEGWKRGEHLPGLVHIGALIAAYPDFANFIRAWAERSIEPDLFTDADMTRAINQFVRR